MLGVAGFPRVVLKHWFHPGMDIFTSLLCIPRQAIAQSSQDGFEVAGDDMDCPSAGEDDGQLGGAVLL